MESTTLFGEDQSAGYILAFRYHGTSFDGQIELGKLAKELDGLSVALRILIDFLSRHGRLPMLARDLVIVVEPFGHGSFLKRIKAVNKHLKEYKATYDTGLLLGTFLMTTLGTVRTFTARQIVEMSPEVQSAIHDAVRVEVLKNADFRRGLASIAEPLVQDDDKLELTTTNNQNLDIDREDKLKLEVLAGKENVPVIRVQEETLIGRITRVDLDAYNNHLGLKVDGSGMTVKCTLKNEVTQEEMTSFLGKWVTVSGTTTFQDNVRAKIDVTAIELTEPLTQKSMDLSDGS